MYLHYRKNFVHVYIPVSLRRADHPSRGVLLTVVRRCVWSRNLKNEEAMTRVGSQRHKKKNPCYVMCCRALPTTALCFIAARLYYLFLLHDKSTHLIFFSSYYLVIVTNSFSITYFGKKWSQYILVRITGCCFEDGRTHFLARVRDLFSSPTRQHRLWGPAQRRIHYVPEAVSAG